LQLLLQILRGRDQPFMVDVTTEAICHVSFYTVGLKLSLSYECVEMFVDKLT